jgi:hypothetical protein
VLVFIYFAIGGLIYFFSSGNEQQEAKSRRMLLDAAIGFMMLLASYALAYWAVNLVLS